MRIDGHLHFTAPDRFRYPPNFQRASTPSYPSGKGHTPEWIERPFKRSRIDGAIAAQVTSLPEETRWLLELAREHPLLLGVIARADLADRNLPYLLDELQRHAKLRGLGPGPESDQNPESLLQSRPLDGLRELARRGLPLDLRIHPDHLSGIPRLIDAVPDLRIAVSHPPETLTSVGSAEQWGSAVEKLAGLPQVFVQVPTIGTGAEPGWKAAAGRLRPWLGHLVRTLGPSRLIFATDWPLCLAAVETWKQALAAFTQALGAQTMEDRSLILGDNAARLYGFESPSEDS